MPDSSKRHDSSPPDARLVAAANARIEQRGDDREGRIARALDRLRYGASAPPGYSNFDGRLLRLR